MSWFGWIPILTSHLIVDHAIPRLKKQSVSITPSEHKIPPKIDQWQTRKRAASVERRYKNAFPEDVRAIIKAELCPKSGSHIFYYFRDFDDVHVTNWKRVAVVIDRMGYVETIGIFGYPNSLCIAKAEILNVLKNGLVEFEVIADALSGGTDIRFQRMWANQLFGEIRDIYHEHVYVPHGDLPLQPVYSASNDSGEAIHSIFTQYQKKIVLYHSTARKLLSTIETAYGRASLRSFHDFVRLMCSARGELTYAKSFANLCKLDQQSSNSINNALSSLSNLSERCKCILDMRGQVVNFLVLFLTLLAAAIAGYHFANSVYADHAFSVTLLIILITLLILRFTAYRQTVKPHSIRIKE